MGPIRPILRTANVTEQQWRVLRVLSEKAAMDVSTIADLALLHGPSVTRILKELSERGLIQRSIDPADARRSVVEISPAGRSLIAETSVHVRRVMERYAEAFGPRRMAKFQVDLGDFVHAMEQLNVDE
ncbi:MAG TPA: MarR family transcriptional regulator [Phenylobacterium sp.]|uniref:MarR family transcriptional regulator n=1 Tax=Phenylobacterium sp. TaxID=1871053 RepID=UPI002B474EF7|nr:MarR family transcriptional regulator [Phenylobacterium sp.]HKR89658.1 MarR family transcriptional regulator [Phenylobacterium sp.]